MADEKPPSNSIDFTKVYPIGEDGKCAIIHQDRVIDDYIDGLLSEHHCSAFQQHFFHCETCFEAIRLRVDIVEVLKKNHGWYFPTKDAGTRVRTSKAPNWYRFVGYAAAAVVLLAIIGYNFSRTTLENTQETVAAPKGERNRVILKDYSRVRLNYGSELRYPKDFADTAKVVYLKGEAFFDIKPGSTPFIINTENAKITVQGTSFNVWARNKITRVVVESGEVLLSSRKSVYKETVAISARETAECNSMSVLSDVVEIDVSKQLIWLTSKHRLANTFSQAPLIEIVHEIERSFNVEITLGDPTMGSEIRLTGSLEANDVERALRQIGPSTVLEFEDMGNNRYELQRRKD